MTNNPFFFTPQDVMAAEAHLAMPGAALVLNMDSGKQLLLTSLAPQKLHGRLQGRDSNEFPVSVDPAKVESFIFATADDEALGEPAAQHGEMPAATRSALMPLLEERESAILDLVEQIKSGGELIEALGRYEIATEAIQAFRDEPHALALERPGEFGGYEGDAAKDGVPPRSVLDEPSSPAADVVSIDAPNRGRGRRGKP